MTKSILLIGSNGQVGKELQQILPSYGDIISVETTNTPILWRYYLSRTPNSRPCPTRYPPQRYQSKAAANHN